MALPATSLPYRRPGSRKASPLPEASAASPSSAERLNLNCGSTRTVIRTAPIISMNGLDDLHVGGALHAADHDVDDHQRADHDDRRDLRRGGSMPRNCRPADAEQQRDQRARADHLGEQVEDRHGDRRDGGRGAHRGLPHPEGQHVGHGEPAGVAQQLGDQQQGDQPRDEEADRVEEAVVAVEGDDAGDAEEGRGRHVVAADRHAVLESGERAAAGVEVGGGAVLPAGPEGDAERDDDEDEEQRDRDAPLGSGGDRGGHAHDRPPRSISPRIRRRPGRARRLAKRA